jgi:hypothetical protein
LNKSQISAMNFGKIQRKSPQHGWQSSMVSFHARYGLAT